MRQSFYATTTILLALAAHFAAGLPVGIGHELGSRPQTQPSVEAAGLLLDVEMRAAIVQPVQVRATTDSPKLPATSNARRQNKRQRRSIKPKPEDEPTIFELDAQLIFQAPSSTPSTTFRSENSATPPVVTPALDASDNEATSTLAFYVDAETWMHDILEPAA